MIRIQIEDDQGNYVSLQASGTYAPDVAHDLKNRAGEAYREMLAAQLDAEGCEVIDDETEQPA